MARINLGNNSTKGFVNFVSDDKKRIVIGTGSYEHNGEKVFKTSVTVFFDSKFDGTVPEKGKFVEVNGDLVVQPNKQDGEKLDATYNIRFKNQLKELEAPQKRETTAPAGADDDI